MSTPSPARPLYIRRLVFEALTDWVRRQESAESAPPQLADYQPNEAILMSMPRREQVIDQQSSAMKLPYFATAETKSTFWKSFGRLFAWLRVMMTLLAGNLIDRILRRDTLERRATRLRQTLENAGGTFVKFGQQAAMRIDLLPWAFCIELSKMLDTMKPFPFEQALETIERTTNQPWKDIFDVFDPVPVGAASVACVYQATLKNGSKVVVKVRRPGILDLFLADLQVLDWICELAEFLSILRPGFTRNLRAELRDILLDELDFRREGRFQDTFRRNAPKSGQTFFSAPKVYFEFSNEEVLVQEFISGLRLWEVIAAVEDKKPWGRILMSQLNIDPSVVARNILWATFWSSDEHIFFHADPHPANIIVRANNEIIFIDFGSCGSFNNQQRVALEQMVLSMKNRDVEAMARATLSLMEPLPPVDLPVLVKQAQEEYMRVLHTYNTPAEYTEYWERTSARQWLGLIRVARKFNVPLNIHMLRMIRATLLYDSIVVRLDNQLDRYEEYTLFMKDRAELVKQKWRKRLQESAGDNVFLTFEDLGKSLTDLLIGAQSTLGKPIVSFGSTVDKWVFTASIFSRLIGRVLLITFLAMGLTYLGDYLAGSTSSLQDLLSTVIHNEIYLLILLGALILNIRHVVFRLKDRDVARI